MAITEKQFLQAFREAACIEFQCIPPNDSDIVHQFSKDFEIKMQKMIKQFSGPGAGKKMKRMSRGFGGFGGFPGF